MTRNSVLTIHQLKFPARQPKRFPFQLVHQRTIRFQQLSGQCGVQMESKHIRAQRCGGMMDPMAFEDCEDWTRCHDTISHDPHGPR
jgi:hypothetical protein